MLNAIRAAITLNGGTPQGFSTIHALRELVEVYGGEPTQHTINGLLAEAIEALGGTATKVTERELLRELVTALGETPGYDVARLWQQVGSTFNMPSLFANGEAGLYYDFSRADTLTLDNGIAEVADLSGNGNDAAQATEANRPALVDGYASFDGTNDALQVPTLDLSASDAVTVMIALRYTPTAAQKVFVELSPNAGTNANAFAMLMNASDQLVWRSHGSSAVTANSAAQVGEQSAVLVGTASISTDLCRLTKNGTQAANSTNDQGSGNYGAEYALNIGARNGGSLFFAGRLHALLIVDRVLTGDELAGAYSTFARRIA